MADLLASGPVPTRRYVGVHGSLSSVVVEESLSVRIVDFAVASDFIRRFCKESDIFIKKNDNFAESAESGHEFCRES